MFSHLRWWHRLASDFAMFFWQYGPCPGSQIRSLHIKHAVWIAQFRQGTSVNKTEQSVDYQDLRRTGQYRTESHGKYKAPKTNAGSLIAEAGVTKAQAPMFCPRSLTHTLSALPLTLPSTRGHIRMLHRSQGHTSPRLMRRSTIPKKSFSYGALPPGANQRPAVPHCSTSQCRQRVQVCAQSM